MNHYRRLGISRNATTEEIRKAYYRKAKEVHPDYNDSPSAHEDMLALTEAYETLTNETARAQYDAELWSDALETIDTASPADAANGIHSPMVAMVKSIAVWAAMVCVVAMIYYVIAFPFGTSTLRFSLFYPIEYAITAILQGNVHGIVIVLMASSTMLIYRNKRVQSIMHHVAATFGIAVLLFLGLEIIRRGHIHDLLASDAERAMIQAAEENAFAEKYGFQVSKIRYQSKKERVFIDEVGMIDGKHYFITLELDGRGTKIGNGVHEAITWLNGSS